MDPDLLTSLLHPLILPSAHRSLMVAGAGDDPDPGGALHPRLAQREHDEQGQGPLLHDVQWRHKAVFLPLSSTGGARRH